MFYYVYVLRNLSNNQLYTGFTTNLKQRFSDHISGKGAKLTRQSNNWELIYFEGYKNKKDALQREKFIKSGSGKKFLKKQLENFLSQCSSVVRASES